MNTKIKNLAVAIAMTFWGGVGHAALMNYTEQLSNGAGLTVLNFQADDSVPTVITSISGLWRFKVRAFFSA